MSVDIQIPGWTFRKSRELTILLPTIAVAAALTAAIIWPGWWSGIILVLFAGVWGLVLWFFRDPDREKIRESNVFYSPGDGVVSDLEWIDEGDHLQETFFRIGIFLSLFDVHVQRAPIAGEVVFVAHQPGKNHPAYDPAASSENEQIVMGIDTPYGKIIVKQIAGILARRCVNFAQSGDQLLAGQRYGLIKFGSRVELYLPPNAQVNCSVGDKVFGGITPLAEIKENE